MPTTIAASNGNTYHLWQLGNLTAPEPEDSHTFSTLDNEMSQGYRSTSLFGLNTGVKSWKLKLPTLAGSSVIAAAVTDPYGATVSREEYVRNLYKYNRTTGIPFAYQDTNTSQYYLVDMVNTSLTLSKKKNVAIYETTVELRQRRINGVTVFSPTIATYNSGATVYAVYEGSNFSTPTWSASTGSNMTASGDVVKVAGGVNGEDYVRFNNTTNNGYVVDGLNAGSSGIHELFLVMKMRESTFSNTAGIATGTSDSAILTGSSGTTKFTNPGLSATAFTYRYNGTEYAQSNMQAPMNVWGVVHVRYTTGYTLTSGDVTIGRNDITDNNYAEVDIAECVMVGGSTLPTLVAREMTEYLAVKYGITLD